MKIGTITFSGAHNYGSVLQAYALQTFVERIFSDRGESCTYQIINYRSEFQKTLYSRPRVSSTKNTLKWLMYAPYKRKLELQSQKFKEFTSQYLNLSKEFSDEKELPTMSKKFDILLAGSDQIWNIRARDFSFAYLFENCDKKKISYAASLGPLKIDWNLYDKYRYERAVKQFSNLSVREEKSKEMLSSILPTASIDVHVDPTLLLSVDEWRKIQSDMNVKNGKYILFYCLEPNKNHLRLAKLLSKKTGLPVVATKYRNKMDYLNTFIKQYDAGPRDFLSLIDNAAMVFTSSFHGTAFSLIYNKPFYVIDGIKDGRISNILHISHAESNSVTLDSKVFLAEPKAIDITNWLKIQQEKSRSYLLNALGI